MCGSPMHSVRSPCSLHSAHMLGRHLVRPTKSLMAVQTWHPLWGAVVVMCARRTVCVHFAQGCVCAPEASRRVGFTFATPYCCVTIGRYVLFVFAVHLFGLPCVVAALRAHSPLRSACTGGHRGVFLVQSMRLDVSCSLF